MPPLPPALMISFEEQKFLILMKSSLSVFPFIVSACLCVPGNLSLPVKLPQCLSKSVDHVSMDLHDLFSVIDLCVNPYQYHTVLIIFKAS